MLTPQLATRKWCGAEATAYMEACVRLKVQVEVLPNDDQTVEYQRGRCLTAIRDCS